MADINVTQAEADALIAMPKVRASDETWDYPSLGGAISIPLISPDRRENFLLDIRKGRIDLSKGSYQNRSRQVIVLVKLDFGGSVHRNPDNTEVAVHTCTYIVKDTGINGRCRCLMIYLLIRRI